MQYIIPTLNTALVFTSMIHGDLTPSNFKDTRQQSLATGNNATPLLRRIIYKAKITARPMQFKKR